MKKFWTVNSLNVIVFGNDGKGRGGGVGKDVGLLQLVRLFLFIFFLY